MRVTGLCFLLLVVGVLVAACSGDTSESAANDDAVLANSRDGAVVGIVTLNPAIRTAQLSDLCFVLDRSFEVDEAVTRSGTTAFAVFSNETGELTRVPFMSSQRVAGSMEFGPVDGFFEKPSPPSSRDAIALPYFEAQLTIEIEGVVVSETLSAVTLSKLPDCTGTGRG